MRLGFGLYQTNIPCQYSIGTVLWSHRRGDTGVWGQTTERPTPHCLLMVPLKGLKVEFLRKSKTDGTKVEKKITWTPVLPRKRLRHLELSSGLRKQAWDAAPTEALVTAEEEDKPGDTGHRTRSFPVWPVNRDNPQKQTLLSFQKKLESTPTLSAPKNESTRRRYC